MSKTNISFNLEISIKGDELDKELNHHRLEAGGFDWRLEAA